MNNIGVRIRQAFNTFGVVMRQTLYIGLMTSLHQTLDDQWIFVWILRWFLGRFVAQQRLCPFGDNRLPSTTMRFWQCGIFDECCYNSFWWQEQETLDYRNQCDAWTPQLRQLQWGVFYEAATLRYSIAARVSFLYCEELQRLCGNQCITVSAVTTFGFFQLQWRHFWFTVSCCVLGSTTSVVATSDV